MRTNINIDDDLLAEAKRLTKIETKRELVHEALRVLIAVKKKRPLSEIKGKVAFAEGYDYKTSRRAS